jgi:hypothetical protein
MIGFINFPAIDLTPPTAAESEATYRQQLTRLAPSLATHHASAPDVRTAVLEADGRAAMGSPVLGDPTR